MGKKTVGHKVMLTEARLKAPPSEQLIRYTHAPRLAREKRRFDQFMGVDMAHTVMLVERKILSTKDGGKILKRLRELDALGPDKFRTDPKKGSFLLQVEDFLADKLGEEIGGRMHTGRSRIDQGGTVERLYVRDHLLDVLDSLLGLQAVIIRVAARNATAIMPGYTHMQHAQPWVFGHYLMGFFAKLNDDCQRLTQAYGRTNINPLGTVGLAGTSWPLDRERTTELLGFGGLVENSRLGLEAHYAIEAISMLSIIMSSMNDLASDLHLWSTYEFGLVETADAYCGSSSIFPQKKNPNALETIKNAAGASTAWAGTALASFRTEGTGDHSPRAVPHMDEALNATKDTLDYMAGILDTLIVHKERMRKMVAENWSTASNLADTIVKEKGLSYRQTHHVVARLVRIAIEENIRPAQATTEMLDRAAMETIGETLGLKTRAVRDALDPEAFVKTRVTTGSVNPDEIKRMIREAKGKLGAEKKWLAAQRRSLERAGTKLKRAMGRIT